MSKDQMESAYARSCYERAQKVLEGFISKKAAINTTVCPNWIGESDCFWYYKDLDSGGEFRLVDAKTASDTLAFDHQLLAEALSQVTGQEVSAIRLPLSCIKIELDPRIIRFNAFDRHWKYEESQGTCSELAMPFGPEAIPSPDGRFLVYANKYNLCLRDLDTGDEKYLTSDGHEDYDYGSLSTAWGVPMGLGLQARWSPDSRRVFVIQRDTRNVKALPVTHHLPQDQSIRPQVTFHKFAYPGEEHIEILRLFAIDITTGEKQSAHYPPIPVTRNSWGFFTSNLGWWNNDSRLSYFVDVDRYYKYVRVVEFDTGTGETKILFEEKSNTQINLMNNGDMWPSFLPLPDTNELLWYSERSGWAHLYLYDLKTGKLKNTVTTGEWLVRDVVSFDSQRREAFIQTGCRTPGRNPYYRDLVRVNIDTGKMVTIVTSDHDYFAGAFTDIQGQVHGGKDRKNIEARGTSPSGNFSVVTRLRVDSLPVNLLLDREGSQIISFDPAKIVGMPNGWQWPEPIKVLAADGKTDIYGVMYRPSDFSPDKSYPVINDLFSTPDFPWSPIGSFDNNIFEGQSFFIGAALAELGFIVVQIDGRGASYRDKGFKDTDYGNLQVPSMLADQVAGLKEMAERYSFMDLTRVGVHETQGGPGVLHGMLDYPEFYKVGVTHMPHDPRLMSASMWGDMYEGQHRERHIYAEDKAENLSGKLLIMNGMLDTTCPPTTVFRLVDALQKANKDFDMLLLPNMEHWFSGYTTRRSWDYLVRHLQGVEPPKEFSLTGVFGVI